MGHKGTHEGFATRFHVGPTWVKPYGNYMGLVWEKATHIYLPEKKKKKKKHKQTFTHFYTNDLKSPVPAHLMDWSGYNRKGHAYNQDALKI